MLKVPNERHPLEAVRIVEEGIFAEKNYCLAEHLRKYNVTQDEYRRLNKSYSSCQPMHFPTRQSALDFISGRYQECMAAFFEQQEKRQTMSKSFLEDFEFPSIETSKPTEAESKPTKNSAGKRLDEETIQLIAMDLLESPVISPLAMARRWNISTPSLYRIKTGEHRALNEATRKLLMQKFGHKKKPALRQVQPQQTPEPEPMPTLPARREPEVAQAGIAPAHIAKAASAEGRTLKQVLEEARSIMRDENVTHVSLPVEGPIKVQRTEILL